MHCKQTLVIVAMIVLLGACATPPKVRVDHDAGIDFAAYNSFAWFVPPAQPGNAPTESTKAPDAQAKVTKPRKVDSLVEHRVRNALLAALQNKGYVQSDSKPDFKVAYALNLYDRPKESGMRIGLGAAGGSGNVGGGVGLSIPVGKRTETVATMTIDIIDAARNAQVWTGTYEMVIKADTITDAEVQDLVDTIMAKYPPRGRPMG